MEYIKDTSVVVSLFLTIGGVAIGLLNIVTFRQLQPVATHIDQVEAKLNNHEDSQKTLETRIATKEQMDSLKEMIEGRLSSLEAKVNYIYQQAYSKR